MIYVGKNITSSSDPLQAIKLDTFVKCIAKPSAETLSLIRQLRIVRTIDAKQYSMLKRRLPYMVCGLFTPPFRKTDNFAYIEYFVLDIDHIQGKGLVIDDVRRRLQADQRVRAAFVSPGEDGLKVIFRLSERCYDAGVFSLFYRLFARQFSERYGLEQVIDARTCDVTRACFVSYDPDVYFNPSSEPVELSAYVDTNQPLQFFDLKRQIEQEAESQQQPEAPAEPKQDVGDDVMANIKTILQHKAQQKKEQRPVFVPQQLVEIMDDLQRYVAQTGVEITEVISIQYGKKLRTRVGQKLAETNVFYGKRGFSVVVSPRTGTNPELNDMVAELIGGYLDTL